ncbi:scm-like with four MBT domains protein 1 isoform X3 [Brienomyrus brachyistius]|uniref:scm-like with four MBT domains protein 1 isoform X3 n=1 Tax=Brienomyrus brachyistius TaxID=42636 RepID=UPI0020B198B3|nr:scm-like with four MBT domains protein 1 isoform X3 [Brienomyrus brachyistius]
MHCGLLEAEGASGQEDSDFNWEEYLEEQGASAVPHSAFKHVDLGLQTGLSPGMKLEVPLRDSPDTYWVATIITTCGQLLLLRYEGFHDDRRADFWCDIMTADLHPIGWSRQQGQLMKPPEGIREKHEHWETLLENVLSEACSVPANLLDGPHRGKNPLDLLAPGASVELQDPADTAAAWGATIEDNVGGRLCLRYAGTEEMAPTHGKIWLFYLHPLLHPPGWAKEHGCVLIPPAVIRDVQRDAKWDEVQQQISNQKHDGTVAEGLKLKDKIPTSAHCFTEGMKLEAIDPIAPFHIRPATVTKVFTSMYFLVEMDELRGNSSGRGGGPAFLCHRDSVGILPVQWSFKNGIQLTPPPGYQGQDFDWADYLKQCGTEAAPQHCFPVESSVHSFRESMKLEAVNPLSPEHIHVATVTKVRGQYIWLNLEGLKESLPEVIVHVDSMDIFPVSWCETNGYPLQHTRKPKAVLKQRRVAVVQPEKHRDPPKASLSNAPRHQASSQSEYAGQNNGKYSCPKIYFNHRCFSGPYLNKGRIAELPQCVGPGSCVLVLKEVLTLLINTAYKPSRVLRELQLNEDMRWQGHRETLKAKYRGKSYRATVELVRMADQVAEFCRRTCMKLECCPNLFGPLMVLERCSENCAVLTKTKYTHYYGKKSKQVGRPPGGQTNLKGGVKRAGRRRKKRKHCFVHKKKRSSASLDTSPGGSPQASGEDEDDLDEEDSLSEDSSSELLDDSEQSEWKSQPVSPTPVETPPHQRRRRKTHSPACLDDENQPSVAKLCLDSSPLEWSVADVVRFIRTTDCAPLARIFFDQEIDGQALLLLTLSTVQECMDLKLGPAVRLCHHIERVKLAFYQQYAD